MHPDVDSILAEHGVTVAQFQAASQTVDRAIRYRRTLALRDLVAALGSALAVAEALAMPHSTITSRCELARIVLVHGAATKPKRPPRDPDVPGMLEGYGPREDCVKEAACLGVLVARKPNAYSARCRPGCSFKREPSRDERLHLAMVGAIGCEEPRRRSA